MWITQLVKTNALMSELLSLQMNVVAILSLLTSGLRWETVRMCARCTAYVCAVVVISQTLSRWGENSNQCPKRIMFKQYYDHLFHSIFLKLFFFFFFFPPESIPENNLSPHWRWPEWKCSPFHIEISNGSSPIFHSGYDFNVDASPRCILVCLLSALKSTL